MRKYLVFLILLVLTNFLLINIITLTYAKSAIDRNSVEKKNKKIEIKKEVSGDNLNDLIKKLEVAIDANDIKTIEQTAAGLLKISSNEKNKANAAKASYVLASHYYKWVKDDYGNSLNYYFKTITLASDANNFDLAKAAKKDYEELEKITMRLDYLNNRQNYNDYMKAAAIYSSPYLRNYNMAIIVYDLVEYLFPNMIPEITYAKAYLYMSEDLKIRDLKKAQELFQNIVDNHKDFNLYEDAALLLAKIKTKNLEEEKENNKNEIVNINEAIELLDLAEKRFNENVNNKKRRPEPEFVSMIQQTRQKLNMKSKIKQGINK